MGILFRIMLLCCISGTLCAQGFIPPAKNKSVVYFVRHSNFQPYVAFVFFDGDKFFADFPGRSYHRYECEPGKHLFWASAENRDFITADLKPNSTYVVLVEPISGAGMPKVVLTPLHLRHKDFHKAKTMILTRATALESEETLEKENLRMEPFIKRSLEEHAGRTKDTAPLLELLPDMAIPIERF